MNRIRLGEVSKIIRFPLAHSDDPKCPEFRVIYHGDIDRISGIVNIAEAARERLACPGSMRLYLLRPGDTVMVFNGMKEKAGICGFVVDNDASAVPATSLCVIRPNDIDSVWLFHRLRTMRERLMALFREKKSIGYISMKDLGSLEIESPVEDTVKSINEIWKASVDRWHESRRIMGEISKANGEIERLITVQPVTAGIMSNLVKKFSAGLNILELYDRGEYRPEYSPGQDSFNDELVSEGTFFLSAEDIVLLHERISDAPLLSRAMLESSAARPKHVSAYKTVSLHEASMLLAEGIIRDHPFGDGNKRTALLAFCAFLAANGHEPAADGKELADIMIALAEKRFSAR